MPIRQPYDEITLLQSIADNDEKAFETVFLHYGDLVHAHIFTLTKSHIISKDLVQDVFLRVWLYRDKLPELREAHKFALTLNDTGNYMAREPQMQKF